MWKLNVNNCSLQTFWTAQNFYWLWWITLIIKYCEDSNLCKALLQQIRLFQFTFIQKQKSSHFLFVQNCLSGTWILRSMLIFSKCFVTQYEQFLWHSSNDFINYFFSFFHANVLPPAHHSLSMPTLQEAQLLVCVIKGDFLSFFNNTFLYFERWCKNRKTVIYKKLWVLCNIYLFCCCATFHCG